MADVNWGILQSLQQEAPIRTATPQAQGAPAPSVNPMAASQEGASLANSINESTRTGLLQQENARANQLQPGVLQQQADTHSLTPGLLQAQKDAHIKAAAEQAANEYALKIRQETSKAFMTGKNQGGNEGGLDAMQTRMMELGDATGALTLAQTRQDIKKLQTENGAAGIANLGSAIAKVVQSAVPATPPSKDPKTGQIIPGNPGKTSLQAYTEQYSTLKKLYPDAPAPSTFKDDGQFHDAFTVPVLATAGPIAKQQAAAIEALKSDDQYKAQQGVKAAQGDLQEAIKTKGPSSQEAKDAAKALQEAQRNATRISIGGGQGTLGMIQNLRNGPADTKTLIDQNTQEVNGTPSPATTTTKPSSTTSSPSSVPEGRVQVTAPDGTVGHIPASQLQEALKSGYKQ